MSEDVKRLEKILRISTESQIKPIQSQFGQISKFYATLKKLMIQDFNLQEAIKTGREFWRCDRINFVAIDGSMFQDEFFGSRCFLWRGLCCDRATSSTI